MTIIEAMKQALEVVEQGSVDHLAHLQREKLIAALRTALRTAIAEAEKQEPVAKVVLTETLGLPCLQWLDLDRQFDFKGGEYLYTTPPAQEFVCSTGLCHYKATSDERLMVEDAVLAEREACAKVCDQFIDEMQKVLPVEKLRETDPYKAFYKANAARIIQNAIRTRANT